MHVGTVGRLLVLSCRPPNFFFLFCIIAHSPPSQLAEARHMESCDFLQPPKKAYAAATAVLAAAAVACGCASLNSAID